VASTKDRVASPDEAGADGIAAASGAPSGPPGGVGAAPVVVIGGGPAGLTAAYRLAVACDPVVMVEQDSVVGGISRTVERDG